MALASWAVSVAWAFRANVRKLTGQSLECPGLCFNTCINRIFLFSEVKNVGININEIMAQEGAEF